MDEHRTKALHGTYLFVVRDQCDTEFCVGSFIGIVINNRSF